MARGTQKREPPSMNFLKAKMRLAAANLLPCSLV
jgi:hypothetical protein